jgi:hypothetical protein
MKYMIVLTTILAGLTLALSPMLFAGKGVHTDHMLHAQWAGFVVIVCGIAMGFKAIRRSAPKG